MRIVIALAIIMGSITLAFSSIKLPRSAIDLDASTQAVSIGIAKETVLDPFVITKAVFYGPGEVDDAAFQSSLGLTRTEASPGQMTLQGFKLEPGTALKIRKQPGAESTYEFLINSPSTWELSLLAQGRIETDTDGVSRPSQSAAPQSFRISFPAGAARLVITLAEEQWLERLPLWAVSLSFFDGGEKDGVPYRFSAIDNGHVRFSEIELEDGKNRELELRLGQPFFLEPAANGFVRFLKLSKDGIALQYTGTVSALGTGWDGIAPTNHMPSILSYLFSLQWLKQTLSVILSIAGLLIGLALR